MLLRGALPKALTVLVLAAVCPAEARDADSAGMLPGPAQGQSGEAQTSPVVRQQDTMATYQGLTVEKIVWPNLLNAVDQQRLRDVIAQKEGRPLDRDLIRQSIRELYASGRFSDIRVEAEHSQDGRLSLLFFTTSNLFVSEVRVEGALNRPTAGQIVNASKLELGLLFTRDKLDRALTNIRQLMEENGYYRSSVTPEERPEVSTQQIAIWFRVDPGPQAHVGSLTVNCDSGCSPQEIERAAKLRPGDPISMQRTSSALERLRKRYQKQNRLLAQVSIGKKSYRPDANAVDYVLDIVPGPKVVVSTEGFRIRRGVLKQNVPIFQENAVDEDLLNEGRHNLLNYLQGRGYFDATVELKKQPNTNGNELQIIYAINAGARHKVVRLEISGNQYFLTETLLPRLQVQPAGRLFANGRYNQRMLANDVQGLENLYRANGFQQVKVTSHATDDYQGHENDIAITIAVDEGLQTRVGAFHIVGNQAFSEAQLSAEINTAEGQPFSEYYIAEDRDNLLNYYFNRGFPHATFEASAKPTPDQGHRMDVTFTIHEGEQIFVDNIYTAGLNFTKPFVAQRELQVKSGDPLSQIDILQTQKRLYDLGIFNQVDTAVQNPDGSLPHKNVLVDVQEAKRYTFTYGLGLEFQTGQPTRVGTNQAKGQTGVSPRASLAVTRLNFRGRDHTITFRADVGSLQQRGLITYVAPRWFNSQNWELRFSSFYDNTLDVTTFTSQRLEGSVLAEQVVTRSAAGSPVTTMDYSLTYRRVKASDIQISPAEIPLLSLPVRVGEPGFSYVRNTRDSDLESTKGSYNAVTAGVATSYFGSEADFSRILAQNSTYHVFGKNPRRERKFVLARSTRVGVENAFGNTSILPPGQSCPDPAQTDCPSATVIPLAERFLAGGGNSHRGFGLNQAGPRDPTTGFPLGGSALFLNSLELRLPPTPLPYFQDNMSFVLFEDAGNVFTDSRAMLDNLLRWRQKDPQLCLQESTAGQCNYSYLSHAVGIGVRYKTPIGPVRFDFGYNLNPPAFPSCQAKPGTSGQAVSSFCTQGSNGSLSYFVPQHASHFNVYFSIGQSF
ncbi:MAG: BamA/TamA family outer membrane protein [Acidobacteriia bacterium]|nr:BamA/TamA family outer membrane protein [Terriglobia bacterium]